jgi:hypothetical protein
MCDYSLQNVRSRPAQVGDKLISRNFGAGTRGFAAAEDASVAVCVLPGTELAFSDDIVIEAVGIEEPRKVAFKTAIFRQINKDQPYRHHDAVEFPSGEMVLLTHLAEGQSATVLQLPAQPATAAEAEAQKRAEYAG